MELNGGSFSLRSHLHKLGLGIVLVSHVSPMMEDGPYPGAAIISVKGFTVRDRFAPVREVGGSLKF